MAYEDNVEKIAQIITDTIFNIYGGAAELSEKLVPENIHHHIKYSKEMMNKEDKYFEIFKIVMKKKVLNIFEMHENYILDEKEVIKQLNLTISDMYFVASFYGNITEDKVLKIYRERIENKINLSSTELEIATGTYNEGDFLNHMHSQYDFNGSYILRFKDKVNNDPVHLVSNYYLIGNYSTELDRESSLISLIWGGYYETLILLKKVGHYATFNRYIFDGKIYFNFLVESTLAPHDDHLSNGVDKRSDQAVQFLNNIVNSCKPNTLYYAKEGLIANHWKNNTSLEEKAAEIFNLIYLNIGVYEKQNMNRDSLKDYTKEKLVELQNKIFHSNVKKLSIQLYGGSESYPLKNETYYFENITSIVSEDYKVIEKISGTEE